MCAMYILVLLVTTAPRRILRTDYLGGISRPSGLRMEVENSYCRGRGLRRSRRQTRSITLPHPGGGR